MKSKIADRIINNTSKETIDKVDQYVLKTIEMNKELEQKAKELLEQTFPWKKISDENIEKSALIEFAVEFAQQNTLTLDTKLDENGEMVDEPDKMELVGKKLKSVGGEWIYGEEWLKARTVKEWIQYAKDLETKLNK